MSLNNLNCSSGSAFVPKSATICAVHLVAPRGPCEGAQVVFQEDNAGPHVEGTYRKWMQGEFQKTFYSFQLTTLQISTVETVKGVPDLKARFVVIVQI